MITEETRRAFGLDDTQILRWRQGGWSQKVKTFLLVAGVSIMVLLGIRMLSAAPLPQNGGQPMSGQRMGRQRMGRQFGPEQQLARMTKQLHLTDDQQAKIKPILEEQHKQMMALRDDTSMSREDRMAKFQQIRKESFEKMHPILTAKQQKQLEQMRPMRRGRRGGGRGPQ